MMKLFYCIIFSLTFWYTPAINLGGGTPTNIYSCCHPCFFPKGVLNESLSAEIVKFLTEDSKLNLEDVKGKIITVMIPFMENDGYLAIYDNLYYGGVHTLGYVLVGENLVEVSLPRLPFKPEYNDLQDREDESKILFAKNNKGLVNVEKLITERTDKFPDENSEYANMNYENSARVYKILDGGKLELISENLF